MFTGLFTKASPETANERESGESRSLASVLFPVAIGSMWLQLYYSATPVWRNGEYYDYAWFVPPIAFFFFFQRWQERPKGECDPQMSGWLLPLAMVLFLFLLAIRSLEGVDPTWRPPMLLHAGMVTLTTLFFLHLAGGKVLLCGMVPVIVFALSAIPYPFQFESALIETLSTWVVEISGAVFHLLGRPVLVSGGIIEYHGTKVEVTEGCSGIQSLQSLVMASLYFGEFFRLRASGRVLLVAMGVVVAVTVNIGRAIFLAHLRFTRGEESFDASHDGVGHVAFAVGGLCLLILARALISRDWKKGVVRRRQTRLKSA